MQQPTNNNITKIEIRIRDNDSLSWYRYHLTFSESGLSVEYIVDNHVINKKMYDLEFGNKLKSEIEDQNISAWPERYFKIFVHDSDKWIIDISFVDDTSVSVSGSRENSSNWKTLLSILSAYDIKIDNCSISKSTTVIPFPDYEKLKKEVEKLRTGLSMLVLERDDLVFIECKNIEMVYMLNIGGLEYKAFELNCAVLRIKRKIELIQAKKNRQEKVVLSAIEEILDVEFAEYQAKLDEQIGKMNAALDRSKGKELTDSESSELKKLYISIVKALHPDLHPDISSEKIKLFLNAVESYKNSDLTGLRIISEMITEQVLPEEYKDALVLLVKEKERLADLIKEIREDIIKIKSEYPYTMKSLIQDPDKIKEKKEELEGTIEEWKKALDLYKSKALDIMR